MKENEYPLLNITEISWDTDGETIDDLPTEVKIEWDWDDWDEEELRGYLRNLRGAERRYDENTYERIERGHYTGKDGLPNEDDPNYLRRIKKMEAFAKEVEELEQLQKSKGWSPRGPSVNVSGSGTGTPLDAEEFGKGLPDPGKQDEVAIAMLSPGSIHVHDMKAESAIKNLMLTPIETTVTTAPPVEANFEMIPATMLEQAIVTATMQAATTNQAVAQGGGSRMVNAPTSIDNSRHQTLTPPSSAHSPGVPPGSGHMGISTPRG